MSSLTYHEPTQKELEAMFGEDEEEVYACCQSCGSCIPLGRADATVLLGNVSQYSKLQRDKRALELGIRHAVDRVGFCDCHCMLVSLAGHACDEYAEE